MTKDYTARVVLPDDLRPDEIEAWNAWCAADAGLTTPFLSYRYISIAAETFENVRVCVIERNGKPAGFLPFQYQSKFHELLGLAGRVSGELNDYFGLIAPAGTMVTPDRLLRLSGLNALNFTHLDDSQGALGLTGSHPEPGLRVTIEDGADAYWAERKRADKRFVADTDRCARKLAEAYGPVRFVFREPDPLPHLERLIAAKRDQYQRTGVADALHDEAAQAFLRRLALSDDPACSGVVSTLSVGETWAAIHFGIIQGATLHYWFPVYNPEFRSYSPGRLLLKELIMAGEKGGIRRVDFGAGDTPAKRDFANAQNIYRRGLWRRDSLGGLLIRASLSLRWRLDALAATRKAA